MELEFPGKPSGKSWNSPDLPSADGSSSPAAQLELFDDVADLLKPVHIPLLLALIVGNHLEKGHSQSGIPANSPTAVLGMAGEQGRDPLCLWLTGSWEVFTKILVGLLCRNSVTGSTHKGSAQICQVTPLSPEGFTSAGIEILIPK